MRFEGRLTRWDDARGFGYIESTQGGEPVFVHVSAWPRGAARPQVAQRLSFEVAVGPKGKRAVNVRLPEPAGQGGAAAAERAPGGASAGQRRQPPSRPPRQDAVVWGAATLTAIPAFLLLLVAVAVWGRLPPWGVLAYLVLSTLTFGVYALDKAAAMRGGWRIAENTLHLLAVFGGWPGALLAQQLLRHKSVKAGFRQVFWATVLLNVMALLVLCTPLGAMLQALLLRRS